jgi:hypothetical protein
MEEQLNTEKWGIIRIKTIKKTIFGFHAIKIILKAKHLKYWAWCIASEDFIVLVILSNDIDYSENITCRKGLQIFFLCM